MLASTPTPERLYTASGNPIELASTLQSIRGADLAGALLALSPTAAAHVFVALPADAALRVLESGGSGIAERLLPHLSASFLAPLVSRMAPDRRAMLFRHLRTADRERLASELPDAIRRDVGRLLTFSPDAAAGLMSTAYLALAPTDSAEHVRQLIRDSARGAMVDPVFVIEPQSGVLRRIVRLRDVLAAPDSGRAEELGPTESVVGVAPTATVQEVEDVMRSYELSAIPVLDEGGVLLGVVSRSAVASAMTTIAWQSRLARWWLATSTVVAVVVALVAVATRQWAVGDPAVVVLLAAAVVCAAGACAVTLGTRLGAR